MAYLHTYRKSNRNPADANMKASTYLSFTSALLGLTTGASTTSNPPTKEQLLERARAKCNTMLPARRDACLRSLNDPNVILVWDGKDDLSRRGDDETAATPDASGAGWQHVGLGPRDVAVVEAEEAEGAIDLAIPIPPPTPTTFKTMVTPSPAPTHLPPIEIDDTISLATTTYPVHRTLQTATLANGTEVRVEQTESQVHDVHVEETERGKGEPVQDKVVVHVRVFVEHVKEAAAKLLKRGLRGLGKRGEVEMAGGADVERVGGREESPWRCHAGWNGFWCGYHPQGKKTEDA